MNLENKLPKEVRECARRMTGSREWAENLTPPEKIKRNAQQLMNNAPAFDSIIEAVKYAKSKENDPGMVFALWDDNPQEFRVLFSNFEVPVFAGYRIVVPDTMLDDALEALAGMDTIEEI